MLQNSERTSKSWVAHVFRWIRPAWSATRDERMPLFDGRKKTERPQLWLARKIESIIGLTVLAAALLLCAVWVIRIDPLDVASAPFDPERALLDLPSTEQLRLFLRNYTSTAHLAGTYNDQRQAEWTRDVFADCGLNASIETYWPLLNYPLHRRVAIISGPNFLRYEASLLEDVVEEDKTSHRPDTVPPFHGYSKNGSVTGKVVYANYGRVEDFQYLVDHGIHLNGTIALMRYGENLRGIKVYTAALYGCVGALIYSDPSDDGPLDKEGYPHTQPAASYPQGPWRSPASTQRGSVVQLSLMTGDPLTPGYAATMDAKRLDFDQAEGLPAIPSLPLSWRDALPLLKATQGHGIRGPRDTWAGGLSEVDYDTGPSEGLVHLVNHVDYKITPIWNVIGRIEGSEEPDKVVILGNHRDAWVYGAVDPSSGSAAMLELARVFGHLLKSGWRPRRTIIIASWDAEEYGLVGSTEWVEDHAEWLSQQGTVYINVDMGVSGPFFDVQATPQLHQLLYDTTRSIPDPRTGKSVYDAWEEHTLRTKPKHVKPLIGRLGSGSDFVAFLDHLGIASVDMSFRGDYGVYHSNYDSFHWMEKFGDPTFEYHRALVQLWGLLALRLSDSLMLPMHPLDYALVLTEYVDELSSLARPQAFPLLKKAVETLSRTAQRFEQHLDMLLDGYKRAGSLSNELHRRISAANEHLVSFERHLIDPQGIPGREWFKHQVYAPGLWTGYASQVFPAIIDVLDQGNQTRIRDAEERAARAIEQAAKSLNVNT